MKCPYCDHYLFGFHICEPLDAKVWAIPNDPPAKRVNDPDRSIFPGVAADRSGWGECGCWTCVTGRVANSAMPFSMPFIVCPMCGNKRCPRATHHDNECSGSNEAGQEGSRCT